MRKQTLLSGILVFGTAIASAHAASVEAPRADMLVQRIEQVVSEAHPGIADVQVVVNDGTVTLLGWVDAPNDVLFAMKAAKSVPGVEVVISNLRTWRSTAHYD